MRDGTNTLGRAVTSICGVSIGRKIGRRALVNCLCTLGVERGAALSNQGGESLSTMSRALLTGPATIATLPCYQVRVVPILQEVAR